MMKLKNGFGRITISISGEKKAMKKQLSERHKTQIGKRLKAIRVSRSIDQKTMGKRLDISQASVSQYEMGNIEPSLNILMAIHRRWKISIQWILTGKYS